ncbi:MAG: hypothetical protein RSC92_00140 [Clostridia bacterium]
MTFIEKTNKRKYCVLFIFSSILIFLGSSMIIVYKLELLSERMMNFMSGGAIVLSFAMILLGVICLGFSIYYYYISKKIEENIKLNNNGILNLECNNKDDIKWTYSNSDLYQKLKIEMKIYNKTILGGIFMGIMLFTKPTDEGNMSFTPIFVLLGIAFLIYYIVKKDKERIILKSGKDILFKDDLILYEDEPILLNNPINKFIKIEHDKINNYLNFYFRVAIPGLKGGDSDIHIYIPFEHRDEVNVIIEKYKYLTE